jgi:hypothetical protein
MLMLAGTQEIDKAAERDTPVRSSLDPLGVGCDEFLEVGDNAIDFFDDLAKDRPQKILSVCGHDSILERYVKGETHFTFTS